MAIQFGCDPECFFVSESGVVLPGTMLFPENIQIRGVGYICHDGIQVEFNPYPTDNYSKLENDLRQLVDVGLQHAVNFCGEKVEARFVPVQNVPLEVIQMAGDADASALVFGCSPDVNVWDAKDVSARGSAEDLPLRFGGGHLHINVSGNKDAKKEAVRNIERLAGLVINANYDQKDEATRRQWYGKAGACRIKDYGVEWRCPSSAIFESVVNPKAKYTLSMYLQIVEAATKGKTYAHGMTDKEVRATINEGGSVLDVWNAL